jgi:hypothetical protein
MFWRKYFQNPRTKKTFFNDVFYLQTILLLHEHDSPDDEEDLLAEDLSLFRHLETPVRVRWKDVLA